MRDGHQRAWVPAMGSGRGPHALLVADRHGWVPSLTWVGAGRGREGKGRKGQGHRKGRAPSALVCRKEGSAALHVESLVGLLGNIKIDCV